MDYILVSFGVLALDGALYLESKSERFDSNALYIFYFLLQAFAQGKGKKSMINCVSLVSIEAPFFIAL